MPSTVPGAGGINTPVLLMQKSCLGRSMFLCYPCPYSDFMETFLSIVLISVSSKPYSSYDIFWQCNKDFVDLDLDNTSSTFPWQCDLD